MKTAFFKNSVLAALACALMLSTVSANAQNSKNKKQKQEEIIIKKKGDKDEKMTIVIDGDKVTVNGEPLAEFKDDDIIIMKRDLFNSPDRQDWGSRDFRAPRPPFPPVPPRAWGFSGDNSMMDMEPRAMLGVYTEQNEKGAKINQVMDDSPAQKAGLAKGDIITKAGDKDITDPSSLSDAIGELKPGDEVQIQYLRDNKQKKVKVTLGEHKSSARTFQYSVPPFRDDMMREFKFRGPQSWQHNWDMLGSRPQLGIRIQDTEDGKGVKVLDVNEESAAEKSGIKKDDIIVSIDGTEIKNADDAKKKMADIKDKSAYPVKVLRNNETVNIDIKIPRKLKTTDL
jgi:serine protease Do